MSLHDEITGKIITELERGRLPWVQPWGKATAKAPLGPPLNACTGRAYSGINILILWGAVVQHGYPGPGWLSFWQALALGGQSARASAAPRSSMPIALRPKTRSGGRARPAKSRARSRSSSASPCSNRTMRGLARGYRRDHAAPAAQPDQAQGRGADQSRRPPALISASAGTAPITLRPLTMWSCHRRKPISSRSTGTGQPCMSLATRRAILPLRFLRYAYLNRTVPAHRARSRRSRRRGSPRRPLIERSSR